MIKRDCTGGEQSRQGRIDQLTTRSRKGAGLLDSTINYTDARGYNYVGMSESWKNLCLEIPCSKRVVIPPGYPTQWIDTTIDGKDVVIQVWKGNCPHVLPDLPGGIGGEVGIYRREPGRTIPNVLDIPALQLFPPAMRPRVAAIVSELIRQAITGLNTRTEIWWPYPALNAQIEMNFVHGKTVSEFFTASPETTGGYWMSRWMTYRSYRNYTWSELLRRRVVPVPAFKYTMEFAVKGQRFRWKEPGSAIVAY